MVLPDDTDGEKKTVKLPKNKNICPQEQLKSKPFPTGVTTVYTRAVSGKEKQEPEPQEDSRERNSLGTPLTASTSPSCLLLHAEST